MLFVAGWMVVHGANLSPQLPGFIFNIPNLIPVAFNALFIPLYIMVMIKEKELGIFNRYIAPSIATLGAGFLVFTVVYLEGITSLWFMFVFAYMTLIGLYLTLGKNKTPINQQEQL